MRRNRACLISEKYDTDEDREDKRGSAGRGTEFDL